MPEAERANTEPEKLAEQRGTRENNMRGTFWEVCVCDSFILNISFMITSHHRATGTGVCNCDSASWLEKRFESLGGEVMTSATGRPGASGHNSQRIHL